jgi:hypothetical protein
MANGKIIGRRASSNSYSSSGVWSLNEAFHNRKNGRWIGVTIADAGVPGVAGKFFTGDWRSRIGTGNIGTLPLTPLNESGNISNPVNMSANNLYGVNQWTSITYGDGVGDLYGYNAVGYFTPPSTGTYTFFTSSDDYSGVWFGDIAANTGGRSNTNATVVNGIGGSAGQGNTKRSGTISLTAGVSYPVRIVHEEGGGGDNLTFSFSGPGISETTALSTYFRTPYIDGALSGNFIRTTAPTTNAVSTYVNSYDSTTQTTSYSFTTATLSPSLVVVVVHSEIGINLNREPSNVTIGSIPAYQAVVTSSAAAGGSPIVSMWYLETTASTTSVVVTFPVSVLRCRISVYTITGHTSTTPVFTGVSSDATMPTSRTVNTNILDSGSAIIAAETSGDIYSHTWSGVTERYDAQIGGGLTGATGGNLNTTTTQTHSITVNMGSTPVQGTALAVAAWR